MARDAVGPRLAKGLRGRELKSHRQGDRLVKQLVVVRWRNGDTVTLYSCGPSLDGPPDLGLCRRVVFADVLRRHLEGRGYEVKHAMNLGDIDDRTVTDTPAGTRWRIQN